MKKIILPLLLLCTSALFAQTYYLNVWSNGEVISIPLQKIQKLAFSNIPNSIENKELTTVITSFKLLQNYPNPFNPNTTIEYQIPKEGKAEIKIFNLNGQLIKIFENNHPSAGIYTVTWDGKSNSNQLVASGLYIYQVTFANSVIAKRMMFIK